jgi:hypothetical protein
MYYRMARESLTVRDVDKETWRRFRAKVEEEGLRTGQALDEALGIWIKEKEKGRKRPDPRSFLRVEAMIDAGKHVRWSEEIDKALYGAEQ